MLNQTFAGIAMLLLTTSVVAIILGWMMVELVKLKENGLSIFVFVLLLLLGTINAVVCHSLSVPTGEILYNSTQVAVFLVIVGVAVALDHNVKLKHIGKIAKIIGAVILAIVLISMFFLFVVLTF